MANEENLLKSGDLTSSELRERARKGGIASGEARREKKQMKACADAMLSGMPDDKSIQSLKKLYPDLVIDDFTVTTLLIAKQIDKAAKGDTRALEFIRDITGQKPVDEKNIKLNADIKTGPSFDVSKLSKEALAELMAIMESE